MRYFRLLYPTYCMSSLLRHTRALQFSAAATLFTAAVTALPLLASDQFDEAYYGNQIVQIFQKMGAESIGFYSNGSLDTSAFDFASYFSNTCFRPTDFDMPSCKEKFGPYANLKETYDSGKLAMILSRVSYMKDIAKLLPTSAELSSSSSSSSSSDSSASSSSSASSVAPASTSSVSSSVTSSASSSSSDLMDRNDRASFVWKLCVKKFITREKSVACYQRNIRLIMERMEPVDENLVY